MSDDMKNRAERRREARARWKKSPTIYKPPCKICGEEKPRGSMPRICIDCERAGKHKRPKERGATT